MLLVGCVVLASQARVDSSYEAYFDPADPIFLAYEKFRDDFGSDEVSYILYAAPNAEHGPWNLDVMRRMVGAHQRARRRGSLHLPGEDAGQCRAHGGCARTASTSRRSSTTSPRPKAALLELRDRFLAKPMYVGGLVSADAQYGAIVIDMDLSSTDPLEEIRLDPAGGDGLDNLYPQATNDVIEEILARPEYSDLQFWHSGDVPLNAIYNRVLADETATLMFLTLAIISVILVAFIRSWMESWAPSSSS